MNLDLCRWWKMNMWQQCVYPGGMSRRITWGTNLQKSSGRLSWTQSSRNPHYQRFWWSWGSGSGGWVGCNNSQGRKVFFILFLVLHHILLFVLVIIVLFFFLLLHMVFPHWESEQGSLTQMTLMLTIDMLSRLSWCRPANILQWLEVPPVDGDRWEVIFNLQGSR